MFVIRVNILCTNIILPSPTLTTKLPAASDIDREVVNFIDPVGPFFDVPVKNERLPLAPARPAFEVSDIITRVVLNVKDAKYYGHKVAYK